MRRAIVEQISGWFCIAGFGNLRLDSLERPAQRIKLLLLIDQGRIERIEAPLEVRHESFKLDDAGEGGLQVEHGSTLAKKL